MNWISKGGVAAARIEAHATPAKKEAEPHARVETTVTTFRSFGRRHPHLAAYAVPMVLAAMVTQFWFRPGAFVAGGDITPFVRDGVAAELFSLWGHQTTGAGSASYQIVRAPELSAIAVSRALGGSNELAQRLFYTLLFVAVAAGAVFFALALVKGQVAALAAGLLSIFNAFVLQHHSPLDLWAIALMGLLGGLVLRAGRGDPISAFWLATTSVLTSYVSLNPPTALMVGIWTIAVALFASPVLGGGATRRSLMYILRAAPWALLLNIWWLFPWAYSISSATGRTFAAQTNVLQWAWTQARDSIPNVLTLSSHWGWTYPQYYPYAQTLDSAWWAPLKFALPLLAFAAPVIVPKQARRSALSLVAASLALIVVSKGLHPPLASLNLFLYRHVPGMWLLREPSSKLGGPLLLSYCALGAMTLHAAPRFIEGHLGAIFKGVPALLLVASIAYPWPLWTGSVISNNPPFQGHVQLPSDWRALADEINASAPSGKVLLLPQSGYYQVPTTWGYYGSDVIVRQLLRLPVVQSEEGGYYADLPGYASLLASIQAALVNGDTAAVPPLLRSLGVSYVIIRRDLSTDYPNRYFEDPHRLEGTLGATPGIQLVRSYSVADLYKVNDAAGFIDSVSTVLRTPADDSVDLLRSSLVGSLGAGEATTATSITFDGVARPLLGPPAHATFQADGPVLLARRLVGKQFYELSVAMRDQRSFLEVQDATKVSVDGTVVASPPVEIPIGSASVRLVNLGGSLVNLDGSSTLVPAYPGVHISAFGRSLVRRQEPSFVDGVFDCHHYDARSLEQVGIGAFPLPRQPGPAFRLTASAHSACVKTEPVDVKANTVYFVGLDQQTVAGSPARLCVWEHGPNRCAPLAPLSASASWQTEAQTFIPDAGTQTVSLFLYADQTALGTQTTTEYRRIRFGALRLVGSGTIPVTPAQPTRVDVSQGEHHALIETPLSTTTTPFSAVGDCHRYDDRTIEDSGIAAFPLPDEPQPAVRLQAQAHSACVTATVSPALPGVRYALHVEYRTERAQRARLCLLQVGPNTCVPTPQLPATDRWTVLNQDFVPQPGTTGLRLFLYAEASANDGAQTVIDYRAVQVNIASPVAIQLIEPASSPVLAPRVSWSRTSASRYQGSVAASDSPFVLVFRDSFDPGWSLDGIASDRLGPHIEVDGYANAWLIRPGPATRFTIAFGPDIWARRAQLVSLASFGAVGLILLRKRRSRRLTPTRSCRAACS
jgi:arabinofuranan 3-O-arabinosyltransferase